MALCVAFVLAGILRGSLCQRCMFGLRGLRAAIRSKTLCNEDAASRLLNALSVQEPTTAILIEAGQQRRYWPLDSAQQQKIQTDKEKTFHIATARDSKKCQGVSSFSGIRHIEGFEAKPVV